MKNICIGLFEGETLPESLAAFKDVKLDLELVRSQRFIH